MDVYLDTCPIGRSKFTVIHHQFEYLFARTSLYRPFGLRPFGRTCAVVLDASKYTSTYRPFGYNCTVQINTLTPCILNIQIYIIGLSIWTVQMDNGPVDRLCYINLDRPDGWQSNEPRMSVNLDDICFSFFFSCPEQL